MRATLLSPGFNRFSQLVFSPRLCIRHWCSKAFPENADHDISFFNLHDLIDLPLCAFCMESRICIRLPPPELKFISKEAGNTLVQFI